MPATQGSPAAAPNASDHYLEALLTKPGALERSEALHQARAEGTFTAVHEACWTAAKKALGDAEGTKALVKCHCCIGTSSMPMQWLGSELPWRPAASMRT